MPTLYTGAARDPLTEYRSRRDARRATAAGLRRLEARTVNVRVLTIVVAAGMTLAAWRLDSVAYSWLLAPVALFVVLVVVHDRIRRRLNRAVRAEEFYEHGLARLEDRWRGIAEDGERFLSNDHLYAGDLDVLGPGSLFELLCIARTKTGEATLARWLLEPAPPDEIRARQGAVAELRDELDLREELAMLGHDVRGRVDPRAITDWSASRVQRTDRSLRLAAFLLALANLATLSFWFLMDGTVVPFGITVGVSFLFSRWLGKASTEVIDSTDNLRNDLYVLTGVLQYVERTSFEARKLVELQEDLASAEGQASARLRRLRRMTDLLQARQSMMFSPVAALLLWGTQFAMAVEAWRERNGDQLAVWLEIVGEFEALSCLAAYAYEHPNDPFPTIVDEGALFEAIGAAHPLIPSGRVVPNDVRLDVDDRVRIVSGSNMSGKSTLLRTVGVNSVLAQAGAPVRCRSLRLSPLAIGASIAVRDSLQDDTSHFYAELLRLRGILGLTDGSVPVLFLVDEILHGTNSHDRLIGSKSVVHTLLDRGALGLATTHDLGLCSLADEDSTVSNVHLQDELHDGVMHFDYLLRPGPVSRSNALALMRSLGLLDDESDTAADADTAREAAPTGAC